MGAVQRMDTAACGRRVIHPDVVHVGDDHREPDHELAAVGRPPGQQDAVDRRCEIDDPRRDVAHVDDSVIGEQRGMSVGPGTERVVVAKRLQRRTLHHGPPEPLLEHGSELRGQMSVDRRRCRIGHAGQPIRLARSAPRQARPPRPARPDRARGPAHRNQRRTSRRRRSPSGSYDWSPLTLKCERKRPCPRRSSTAQTGAPSANHDRGPAPSERKISRRPVRSGRCRAGAPRTRTRGKSGTRRAHPRQDLLPIDQPGRKFAAVRVTGHHPPQVNRPRSPSAGPRCGFGTRERSLRPRADQTEVPHGVSDLDAAPDPRDSAHEGGSREPPASASDVLTAARGGGILSS